MTKTELSWSGGGNGRLLIGGPPPRMIERTHELIHYLHETSAQLSAPELELLGALTFFLALREYGPEARLAPVLPVVERALGSWDVGVTDALRQRDINRGITFITDVLFPHRAEEYHQLVHVAFDAIMDRFKWLRLRVVKP